MRVLFGAIVLGVAAFGVVQWSASGPSGGDPHGQMLAELKPVASAVPPGSSMISTQLFDSTWHSKCPDNPSGRDGWSEVRVNAQFASSLPHAAVVTMIGSFLVKQGWVRHDTIAVRPPGSLAQWSKKLKDGIVADAFVYPLSGEASKSWFLTATADPPGYSLPGC